MKSQPSMSSDLGDDHATSNPIPSLMSNTSPYPFYEPAPALAQSRYNRQLLIPQISLPGQERISRARVLIIGLGGLGSPASLYLAGAGVHTLGLLDHDVVEQSNLHRQIVHRESSVAPDGDVTAALSKVQSALRGCRELNSEVNYVVHEVRLSGDNALEIIGNYDIVLDCTDNPATRYLISDCCVVLGKTLVSGAAQRLEGQIVVLNWPVYGQDGAMCDRGPCYRCVFPHPPSPDLVKSCSEIGILGPVVGAIGTLLASETLRLIVKDGQEERKPTMLLYNAWPTDPRSMFRVIGLRGKRKDCVVCGDEEVLLEKGLKRITKTSIEQGSMDYASWCGIAEDVNLLEERERIDARTFLNNMNKSNAERPLVVDVREEFEVELGPKIAGSINIPITKILRGKRPTVDGAEHNDSIDSIITETKGRPVCFVCQRGNDSQIAARKLSDRMNSQTNGHSTSQDPPQMWIGDVKGGLIAIDRITQPG